MVEVLGGRAREPTGPRRAPRTLHQGPVQPQLRRAGPREDVEAVAAAAASVTRLGGVPKVRSAREPRVPLGPVRAVRVGTSGPEEDRGSRAAVVAAPRNGPCARSEEEEEEEEDEEECRSEDADPTGRNEAKGEVEEVAEGEEEEEEVDVSRPYAARFENKSEPGSGSRVRSEAGERDVAERRYGDPCGQQPVDEADGHRPQGTAAPRLGVHRRRRRHFRAAGFGDHRQQRPDAQSVSITTRRDRSALVARALGSPLPSPPLPPPPNAALSRSHRQSRSFD